MARIALASVLFLLLAPELAAAQNVWECVTDDLELEAHETGTSILEIIESKPIRELNVRLVLSTTFAGAIGEIDLESPAGTTVRLHDGNFNPGNSGGRGDDIDVTYSDIGDENGIGVTEWCGSAKCHCPYDCDGCRFKPFSLVKDPGSDLSAFDDEDSDGEWSLTIETDSFTNADLDYWCLINYPVAAVEDLACAPGADEGEFVLTWTNVHDCDRIEVAIDGVVVATELEDVLAGDAVTITGGPLPTPQTATFEVTGIVVDSVSAMEEPGDVARCELLLTRDPVATMGQDSVEVDFDEFFPFVGLESFDESLEIGDLTVYLEARGEDVARGGGFWLTSPSGTTVVLATRDSAWSSPTVIHTTFSQLGVRHGYCDGPGGQLDCDGGFMQADGDLRAFIGESTVGDSGGGSWVLTGLNVLSTTTLNSWRVDVFDVGPALPARIEYNSCEQTNSIGEVQFTFTPGSDYSGAEVWANGELVDTILPALPNEVLLEGIPLTWNSVADGDLGALAIPPSEVEIKVRGLTVSEDPAPGPFSTCNVPIVVTPISLVHCAVASGDTVIDCSWRNGIQYDGIDVYIEGEYVETLSGDAQQYLGRETDANGVEFVNPSTIAIELHPYVEIEGETHYGQGSVAYALLLPEVDVEACFVPEETGVLDSELAIGEPHVIEECEILTDIVTGWSANMWVTSPSGTIVRLKDGGGAPRLVVLWDDDGEDPDTVIDFECACAVHPEGSQYSEELEGSMSAFDGESSAGTWSLELYEFTDSWEDPWINHWCIRITGCDLSPPTDLLATVDPESSGNLDVLLEWSNGESYRELEGIEIWDVTIPGESVLVSVLDGSAQELVIGNSEPRRARYEIVAYHATEDCKISSHHISVAIGVREFCSVDSIDLDKITSDFFAVMELESSASIERLDVQFQWSRLETPDHLELTSPSGTTVELMTSDDHGFFGDPFHVLFDDDGSLSARSGGDSRMPVGVLSMFNDEKPDGEWVLYGEKARFEATLESWCIGIVEGCTAPAPVMSACAWTEDHDYSLTWSNGGTYDEIVIEIDDVPSAILPGDATSHAGSVGRPGRFTFRVRAFDGDQDCFVSSLPCTTEIGILAICDEPFPGSVAREGDTAFVIFVAESVEHDEVECAVDFESVQIKQWRIELTDPSGTEIVLFDQLGRSSRLWTIFSDQGVPQDRFSPPEDFRSGRKLQSFERSSGGVGSMADLTGHSSGDWTLTFNKMSSTTAGGNVAEWCVRFIEGCTIDPVRDVRCSTGGESSPITVSWENEDPDGIYTEIWIYRNGELITELDGSTTEYTDDDGRGELFYSVVVYSDVLDCLSRPSETCFASLGFVISCASEDADFEPATTVDGEPGFVLSTLEYENEELASLDGLELQDESPMESGRVDISELALTFSLETPQIGDVVLALASPSGTTINLWANEGGMGAWDAEDLVSMTDYGRPVPADAPDECSVDSCRFQPSSGRLLDFVGEDAQGTWVLVADGPGETTIHEWCIHFVPDTWRLSARPRSSYLRGDVDGDGVVSVIVDVLHLLDWRFGDGETPPCVEAADIDGNGTVTAITDALRLLHYFFADAPRPPAPFPGCGEPALSYEYVGEGEACEAQVSCGN